MKRSLDTITVSLGLATILALLFPSIAFAQGEDIAILGGMAFYVFLLILSVVINIAILVWVARDAQARGSSAGAWLLIVFLFGFFGLLAYLIFRPKGRLVPCPVCGKNKPITDPICPHCGFLAHRGQGVVGVALQPSPPVVAPSPPAQPRVQAPPAQPRVQAPPAQPHARARSVGQAAPRLEPTERMGGSAQPAGWLVARSGNRSGQSYGLTRGKNAVGRDARSVDIVLDDPMISSEHASIRFEGEQFYIYDLASSNGTYVNNRRVQRQVLMDGDVVRFGNVEMIFKKV